MTALMLPKSCPACSTASLRPHCEPGMGRCSWLRCASCRAVTAIILGALRTVK